MARERQFRGIAAGFRLTEAAGDPGHWSLFRANPKKGSAIAVDVSAVADSNHEDDEPGVLHLVDDPPVSYPNPPAVLPDELLGARGAGTLGESIDSEPQAVPDLTVSFQNARSADGRNSTRNATTRRPSSP